MADCILHSSWSCIFRLDLDYQPSRKDIMCSLIMFSLSALQALSPQSVNSVDVFYKEYPPSLETLEQTNEVLGEFTDFEITYHIITDSASADLIQLYNLPDTHFPFAVIVNGRYSAMIEGEKIDFVHFPLFMQGIGRHEGNWSMTHLRMVLSDTSLLMDENTLIELDESGETECLGEDT